MAAFNPWAGFGQQQFPPGFGGFGGVPMGGPQFWGPDQGVNQGGFTPGGGQIGSGGMFDQPGWGAPQQIPGWTPQMGQDWITANTPPPQQQQPSPPQRPPQLGGVGGAPVGPAQPQYPDWFVQAGQQNGMNPRQMEVEWQRFMQSQGGGGRQPDMGGGGPPYLSNDPNSPGYWDERARSGGNSSVPRGGYGQMGTPRQFDPSRTGGPRGNEGGKMGPGGGPQVGMIGGAPITDRSASGRMLAEGKSNAAPEGQAAGSGKWQYHANGSRTWKPNKPKPVAKPTQTTRPPVPVKPGPGGGPTPQPSPTANNDTGPSTSNKPPVANTPPIYVPGTDMVQSSGSMPSLAASLNKRRPGQ